MRTRFGAVAFLSGWVLCTAPARAEGTWIAVPGRPDVPVVVNPFGFDSANTVVEGDFGLDRPAQINPHTVGPLLIPVMKSGRRVPEAVASLGESRTYAEGELGSLPTRIREGVRHIVARTHQTNMPAATTTQIATTKLSGVVVIL